MVSHGRLNTGISSNNGFDHKCDINSETFHLRSEKEDMCSYILIFQYKSGITSSLV